MNLISKYKIEGTEDSAFKDLKLWLKNQSTVAIDSETRPGIFPDEMILFQIGNKWKQWCIDTRDYDLEPIRRELESKKLLKIGHNIKYDYKILKGNFGITLENVYDTMVNEYILSCGISREKGYYSLEKTYERYFKHNPYGDQLSLFDPYIPKKIRNQISRKSDEPFELSELFYGKVDIISAYKVYEAQIKRLESEDLLRISNLENKFTLVLGDMELNGFPLNINRWLELAEWSKQKLDKQLATLQAAYPEIENWNSAKQVGKLFKSLGIPITTKQGKDSVQEIIIKEHSDKFPIIKDYLLYKRYQKLTTTYGVDFLKYIDKRTGRIHTSFQQILNTGRISSSSPNLNWVL